MPTSVPTTRPPRGREWFAWTDPLSGPGLPWQYDRVLVWRSGWRGAQRIRPKLGERDNIAGLYWSPDGRRLTPGETVRRLMRG